VASLAPLVTIDVNHRLPCATPRRYRGQITPRTPDTVADNHCDSSGGCRAVADPSRDSRGRPRDRTRHRHQTRPDRAQGMPGCSFHPPAIFRRPAVRWQCLPDSARTMESEPSSPAAAARVAFGLLSYKTEHNVDISSQAPAGPAVQRRPVTRWGCTTRLSPTYAAAVCTRVKVTSGGFGPLFWAGGSNVRIFYASVFSHPHRKPPTTVLAE